MTRAKRQAWMGVAAGLLLGALGALGLGREGLSALARRQPLAGGHRIVAGLHFTRLGAILLFILGGVMVLASAGGVPGAGGGALNMLGAASALAGLIVLVASPSLHGALGVHPSHGLLLIALGAAVVAAGAVGADRRRA